MTIKMPKYKSTMPGYKVQHQVLLLKQRLIGWSSPWYRKCQVQYCIIYYVTLLGV